ncbi:DUF397 domain-containing protein [Nonomuraea sp. PA05]|uniref:DUF397 domain-containing protein n=1 Tax=Nonomuraea sp. PA05 TaxID=2604466 RepID=UPI0011D44966|nr:DUF397 domain-containing protein [Nonomuraea sp. PA05]TYB61334.1 DUF397 domain-containing protein [Nonomuraea sp. PA05]
MTGDFSSHQPAWQRACNSGNCVEVAIGDGRVRVRDSKDGGDGPVLDFSREEWTVFVDAVRRDQFSLPE